MRKVMILWVFLLATAAAWACPKPKIHTATLKAIEWGCVKRDSVTLYVDMDLTRDMIKEKFGKGAVDRKDLDSMTYTYSLVYEEYAKNHGMTVVEADLGENRKAIVKKQKELLKKGKKK
ncbi:MAG: hypothetical protein LBQ97_07860 [Fusobacteriaceae bacterium]|jgi:hypothetical protein|nr:hypothetical protein [Fusobacteriaceae bacterium]